MIAQSSLAPSGSTAVYVDDLRSNAGYHGPRARQAARVGARRGHMWCHLWCADTDALDVFAARIGLKREWRDSDHYDLCGEEWRQKAVDAGAQSLPRRDFARMVVRHRMSVVAEASR